MPRLLGRRALQPKRLLLSAFAAALLVVSACDAVDMPPPAGAGDAGVADSGPEIDPGPPCVPQTDGRSFLHDVQPILTMRCSGADCHPSFASNARPQLVGMPAPSCGNGRVIVKAGRPATSYLLDKIIGRNLCNGARMPLLRQPLSSAEIDAISDWICAGAADN